MKLINKCEISLVSGAHCLCYATGPNIFSPEIHLADSCGRWCCISTNHNQWEVYTHGKKNNDDILIDAGKGGCVTYKSENKTYDIRGFMWGMSTYEIIKLK